MSDNDVTVEKVEAELFRILNGMSPLGAGGEGRREWRRRGYYLKALRSGRSRSRVLLWSSPTLQPRHLPRADDAKCFASPTLKSPNLSDLDRCRRRSHRHDAKRTARGGPRGEVARVEGE